MGRLEKNLLPEFYTFNLISNKINRIPLGNLKINLKVHINRSNFGVDNLEKDE